jgi:hypothetical protein
VANPSSARLYGIPGRLCKDPTDLSAEYPHGGTALGTFKDFGWRPRRGAFTVHAEEFGCEVDAVWTGESGILACVARELDNDFLAAVFLDTLAGATTGRRVVRGRVNTDGFRAGTELASLAAKLYYSPDDPNAHGILLYRAIPLIDAAAEINLKLREEVGLLCLWQATPDSEGRVVRIGPRGDL